MEDLFCDVRFRSSGSRDFADYWQNLPKQDLIPYRRDFDPVGQGPILATNMIHELISRGTIRIHLVGTEVGAGFGQEPTGRSDLDFVAVWRRADVGRSIFLTCGVAKSVYPPDCWQISTKRSTSASVVAKEQTRRTAFRPTASMS